MLWTKDGASPVADGPDTVIVSVGPRRQHHDRRCSIAAPATERWTTVRGAVRSSGVAAADEGVVVVGAEGRTEVYDAHTGAPLPSLPIGPASDTSAVRLVDGVATGVSGVEPDAERDSGLSMR